MARRAEVAARRADPGEAERRLRAGRDATGGSPELNRALGRVAAQLGDVEKVVASFSAAQQARPGDAISYLELAELLQERFGQTERSLAYYDAASARDPSDWRTAYGRGLALARTGDPALALTSLAEAAGLNLATPLPDFSSAQVLLRLNRQQEALVAYDAALARSPDMAEARRGRGALLVGMGRPRDAVLEFERALSRLPNDIDALLGIGMAQQAAGNLDAAGVAYRTVLVHTPRHPIALNNLAWIAAEGRRDLDDALRWAEGAVAALPNDASVLTTLGWVRRQQGEFSEAERVLARAVTLQSNSDRLMRLAGVRAALGQRDRAVADLRRALQADPGNTMARQELQRLEARR